MTCHARSITAVLRWLPAALVVFLPACYRFLHHGWSEPAGLVSDAALGAIALALTRISPLWFRAVLLPAWGLLHLVSLELLLAQNRLPVFQDIRYLADPDFLRASSAGFHVASPLYAAVLVVSILPALLILPRRRGCAGALACAVLGALLLGLHVRLDAARTSESVSGRFNPLHWLVVDAPARRTGARATETGRKVVPRGLRNVDLSGNRLIPAAAPVNVLIIALEGIPGLYLQPIRETIGIPAEDAGMSMLAESAADGMFVPDFVVHSHQTIRGLYAIHCGDFSKLSFETPKAVELQLSPGRASACLPAQLRRYGWRTHYLQGAPLQFMDKDRAMPAMGFEQVHGSEWFAGRTRTDFAWGAADDDFFAGARTYVTRLQSEAKPWLLSLLTVGTHQPFAVTEESLRTYPSRKRAAVAELDEAVSGFVGWLRREHVLDDTLVIITSDESHGAPGPDWISSWGLGIVLAPERAVLPRIKRGTYGLVDIEASILDYFGLPMPEPVKGRSLFRDYSGGRDIISYTGGKMRYQSAGDRLLECGTGDSCRSYAGASIIGFRPPAGQSGGPNASSGLRAVAEALDHELIDRTAERVLQFGEGRIRTLPETLRSEWSDNLIGAQYLDFPEHSTVRVDIDLKTLAATEQGVKLRLVLRQFEQVVESIRKPEFPLLHAGESCSLSFSFHNTEKREAFSFHLIGEGKDTVIRIDRFQVTISADAG